MKTKKWLKAASVRAIKTMAQALIAQIGTEAVGVTTLDWAGMLSVTVMAGILSILTSIAGIPEVNNAE